MYIPVYHTNGRSIQNAVGIVVNRLVGMGLYGSSDSCKRQSKKQQNKKLTHARIQDGEAVFTCLYR